MYIMQVHSTSCKYIVHQASTSYIKQVRAILYMSENEPCMFGFVVLYFHTTCLLTSVIQTEALTLDSSARWAMLEAFLVPAFLYY